MDTDKRNADLLIKLKRDGLTKTKFFRAILGGYLSGNPDLMSFIGDIKEENGTQSIRNKRIVDSSRTAGEDIERKLGLTESEVENIFDILEKELGDL
jgi:hypothetical protein